MAAGTDSPTAAYAQARAQRRGEQASPRAATPADAFNAARELFLAGTPLDMQALARQVGVSRGTLYRWTGDRERLLADVVWSYAEEIFEYTDALADRGGAKGLARGIEAYMRVLVEAPALRAFLLNDRELALRVLTRRGDGVQERSVARLTASIERERDRGTYAPRLAPGLLAAAIVRLIEGFVFNDIVAGHEPDLGAAGKVIRALL